MIEDDFCANFKKYLQHINNNKIAIAVSGGADSLAMTFMLKEVANHYNIELFCLTVDHAIRAESKNEAKLVAEILNKYSINHFIITNDIEINSNMQEQARNIRYNLLSKWCKDNQINNIFFAHNFDDQAETVLIRIIRGSSVKGLSGINEISDFNDIKIIRPLLKFKRNDIEDYLIRMGINWINDPSNENDKYLRNKLRKIINNDVLCESNILKFRLNKLALNCKRIDDFISRLQKQFINDYVDITKYGYITISLDNFLDIDDELKYRVLVYLIDICRCFEQRIRSYKIIDLMNNIKNYINFRGVTLSGCFIFIKNNDIIISREVGNIKKKNIKIEKSSIIWDNRFFISLNSSDEYQIKSLDIIDLKETGYDFKCIPKNILQSLPALYLGNTLKAVPLIGYFLDNKLKNEINVFYIKEIRYEVKG